MNIRKALAISRLRRPRLRVQLTVLYSGLFVALVAAVLGASGLLFGSSSSSSAAPQQEGSPVPAGGGDTPTFHFDVWPAIVALVAVLAALWLGWWIAGRFLRPLRAMNATAQEISATNLHQRLGLEGPDDELSELGRTLDDLFGRLEASFESQRHFVANASHELRTPLAGQRTLLQVALADPDASTEGLRAACEEALQLGEQQERLIDALLTLATSERGVERWESFDLGADRQTACSSIADRTRNAEDIHVDANIVATPVLGDPRLVESLVSNLMDNALRHNMTGGRVEVSTSSAPGRSDHLGDQHRSGRRAN